MSIDKLKNVDIAYLIGAFQSDGYFYIFKNKKRKKTENRFGISGKINSLPMIKNFQKIFNKNFKRNIAIQMNPKREDYTFRTTINRLLKIFYDLEILPKKFNAPKWIEEHKEFFGAYLAGLIDGDGSVRIKRKRYPQCMIKITSEKSQNKLANSISKFLNCAVSITPYKEYRMLNGKVIKGKWYELEFLVSSKNYRFVKTYILPNLTIAQKKEILEEYFIEKFGI